VSKIISEHSEEYRDIALLTLSGDLDTASLDELRRNLQELHEAGRPFVIVNVRDATRLDGCLIGEIIYWRKQFVFDYDGNICFSGPGKKLEQNLRDLDADKIFRIFADNRSATNYFFWEYKGQIDTIILSIPNSLKIVPVTRKFIRKACEAKSYSGREAFQIETIVDELCNNAIEHGAKKDDNSIELSVAVGRRKVEINISNGIELGKRSYNDVVNNMEKFVESPSNTLENPRGRGLALVKMLSSEFDIDGSESGTCVHVTKLREEK
jgi:anti-sigma regulatory factor (Ser/Thr protein kinase)/anti-anti-sigma regulatory factor